MAIGALVGAGFLIWCCSGATTMGASDDKLLINGTRDQANRAVAHQAIRIRSTGCAASRCSR